MSITTVVTVSLIFSAVVGLIGLIVYLTPQSKISEDVLLDLRNFHALRDDQALRDLEARALKLERESVRAALRMGNHARRLSEAEDLIDLLNSDCIDHAEARKLWPLDADLLRCQARMQIARGGLDFVL